MADKYDWYLAYKQRKQEEEEARQAAWEEERAQTGKVTGTVVAKTWHEPMEGEPLWMTVRDGD